MKIRAFSIVVISLITIFFILIRIYIFAKNSNVVNNKNIWWSKEWVTQKKNNGFIKKAYYSGSEFRFSFKGSKSLLISVNVGEDREKQAEFMLLVDDKEYLISNPNVNSKRIGVVFEGSDVNSAHTARGIYYCTGMISSCEVFVKEIRLEGGGLLHQNYSGQKVVGVLGDSISLIYGSENYSSLLSKKINYQLHNASSWGGTLSQDGGKKPAILTYKERLIEYKPDLVIIALGMNDVFFVPIESFKKDYEKLIYDIKYYLPKSKIVAMGVFPGKNLSENFDKIISLNSIVKDVALEDNVNFFDTISWLDESYYGDRLHPNVEGEAEIANRIYTYLMQNKLL